MINIIGTPLCAMQSTPTSDPAAHKQLTNAEIIKKIFTATMVKKDLLSIGSQALMTTLTWAGLFLLMNKILLQPMPLSQSDHDQALAYAQQAGLDPNSIKISGGASPLADTAQAIIPNNIVINPNWYSKIQDPNEKKFIIGHEAIHLLNHHLPKRFVVALATGLAVKFYTITSQHFFEFLKQKYNNPLINKVHLLHSCLLIPLSFAQLYPVFKYAQSTEKEADIESATRLNCAQAGKNLFTRINDVVEKQPTHIRYINTFLNFITGHPTHKERADYLGKLAQQQAAQAA
jgi:hypothetical protein